jgi:hypothetical protein
MRIDSRHENYRRYRRQRPARFIENHRGPAVARAGTEFLRRKQAREFGRLIREGAFDDPAPTADSAGHDLANPVPPLYPE